MPAKERPSLICNIFDDESTVKKGCPGEMTSLGILEGNCGKTTYKCMRCTRTVTKAQGVFDQIFKRLMNAA